MGGLEMLLFDEAHDTAYVEGGTESGHNAQRVERSATDRLWRQGRELDLVVDVSSDKWQDASTIMLTAETRPSPTNAVAPRPRGVARQYLYSAAEDTLVTARERRVIP
jgi:hypothetical protein